MHELVYIAMGVLHPLDRFKTEIRFSKLAFYITNANNSAEIRISGKTVYLYHRFIDSFATVRWAQIHARTACLLI